MAKRVLLFVVCCFFSVSLLQAQCNKIYKAIINEKYTLSSEFNGMQYVDLKLCTGSKANFRLTNLDNDVLKIRWYKNDSLVATTPDFETNVNSVYRAEVETKSCIYSIGNAAPDFSDNLQVTLTEEDITICENGSSYFYLYAAVTSSMADITYQWQKDGKDISGSTDRFFSISTPGSYTVRATAGTCSSTSRPAIAKGNKDNLLTNLLSYNNGVKIKKDTIFICKDALYTLSNSLYSEWYLDGKYVSSGYGFTPTQSGVYTTSYSFGNNCFSKSKPLYISVDTKISPFEPDFLTLTNHCNAKHIEMISSDLKSPNQLKFYDFSTNKLLYTYSTPDGYFYQTLPNGKYKVELEKGVCKSIPTYWDLTQNKLSLKNNSTSIGGKKINLCSNNYMEIYVHFTTSDEVSLYRDGVLVEKRPNFEYGSPISFKISSTGKYYIKTFNKLCPEKAEILSDTVEIIIAEPISTQLSLSSTSCDSNTLKAVQQEGYSYYWYKENTIIPNETSSTLKLNPGESGNYHAVLQKGLCSVATQTVTFGNKIIGSANLCQDSVLVLESKLKNADITWKGPNGFTSKQPIIRINHIKSEQAGWYFLSTNTNGCIYKDSVNVKITAKPEFSFEFASPLCLNQDVVVKFKATPGYYNLNYSLLGSNVYGSSLQLSGENVSIKEKYVNLGKIVPNGNQEFFTYGLIDFNTNTVCTYPLAIPSHANTLEVCNDNFEFTNLKETYCYREKIKLKFKFPADLPKNKKFKISLETSWKNFVLGGFSGDSAQVSLPDDVSSSGLYFIIEDEAGKFVAMSKNFKVSGFKTPVYAIVNNTYTREIAMHCEGYSTLLRASLSLNANQSLQWRKNGLNIVGAKQTDFVAKDSGLYTVSVTDGGCTVESDGINVIKGAVPKPNVVSLIGIQNVCNGFSVPLTERGFFPYTGLEWSRNGKVIEKKYDRTAFNAKETGYYKVTASQGSCKETSDSVFIEVSNNNLPNRIVGYGTNTIGDNKITICDQTSATFYHSNYYFSSSTDTTFAAKYGFSFQWKRDNKIIQGANKGYYTSNEPGLYHLQMKQGDCVVNSNKIEVVRQNVSSVALLNSYNYDDLNTKDTLVVCTNTSLYIYPHQGNETMSNWNKELYKDGKLINSFSVKDGNNYLNSFPIKDSGKYFIKLYPDNQKSCIAYSDTNNILFADRSLQLPMDTVFSCNDSITLYAPNLSNDNLSSTSYQWTFKNKAVGGNNFYLNVLNEEGIYTVEMKIGNKCSTTQSILVKRNLEAILVSEDKQPVNAVINLCEGMSNSLLFYVSSGIQYAHRSSYVIEWYRNQQKLPDTVNTINANQPGEYFVRTKFRDCEARSNSIKVEVSQIKNQITPKTDSLDICINGGFRILETNKDTGYTYEWFKDNVGLEESSSTLKATQPGIYKALIQSGDCATLTPKVKLYPSTQTPTATISGDTTLNIGDTANLKLSFTSSPPFTYKLSNNQEGTSDKNTVIYPVKIQESNVFKLASIKNACGEGTVSGEAKVNIIILGNEPLIGHKITIAPVPAESYCEIIFDLPVSQEVSYQLLNMKGQQLAEKNLGNVTYKKQYLNLNQLTAGEYLIRIQVGKDFVTRKLIKY